MTRAKAVFGLAVMLLNSLTGSGAILLSDSFDATTSVPDSTDVNYLLGQRQSGMLRPVTYTKGFESMFSQVGNGGCPTELLLAGRAAGIGGAVSLDHNFTEYFDVWPGAPLGTWAVIEFDVNPVLMYTGFNETQTSWVAVTFGSSSDSRNSFPQNVDGMGILFRGNREYQAFNAGTSVGVGAFAPQADHLFHHIRITLAEPTGGNPFLGISPVIVSAFADGKKTPFFSFVRTNGFTQNYISLIGEGEGSGGDEVVRHLVDNLTIGLDLIPSPELSIAWSQGNAMFTWPAFATGYKVYTASSLAPSVVWSSLTNAVLDQGTNFSVTIPVDKNQACFRLQRW